MTPMVYLMESLAYSGIGLVLGWLAAWTVRDVDA